MSSSIVLSLRMLGMPDGAEEVLVMAVALGLFLAVAVSLWRPMGRRGGGAVGDVGRGGGARRLGGGGAGLGGRASAPAGFFAPLAALDTCRWRAAGRRPGRGD